jgi:hypothetical protein
VNSEGYSQKKMCFLELESPLKFLSAKEIGMIDDFLSAIDKHGELRLVVHKGRLRFVTRTEDYDLPEAGADGG